MTPNLRLPDLGQTNTIIYKNSNADQNHCFPRLFYPNEPFVLQPSLFHDNNVPPTIYFNTKLDEDSRPPIGLPKKLQPLFKWRISNITPNTIRNCISFMKFDVIRPSNLDDVFYLGAWCKHMTTTEFNKLDDWRKVNHYPGSFHMGRKDKLWMRLKLASNKFGRFHPRTFVLPKDYDELSSYWTDCPNKLFIIKPPASARGNGIKVINQISQIPETAIKPLTESNDETQTVQKKSTIIVQEYLARPCLLENGYKFDLRIYVLLTSVDPLRVYVHDEGLVRFASSKYTSQQDGIIDQYMHLTNYFVNKNNLEYQINNDRESLDGCKWSLKRFWRYLSDHYNHIDTDKLRKDIIDIIIKTCVACEGPMFRLSHQFCKNDYTSYELFGFDIILDENFKPWILEVNITPSLKSESILDKSVKYRVVKDMFNLVGYHLPPPSEEIKSRLGSIANQHLFFEPRLYQENLTKRDRIKHLKYQKLFKQSTNHRSSSADEASRPVQQLMNENSDRSTSQRTNGSLERHLNFERAHNNGYRQTDLTSSGDEESTSSANDILMSRDSILSDLSQSDARVLMIAEDELSRCGQFKRVFPSAESNRYLKYFDRPRYYNLLLDAWEQKYKDNRSDGLKRLRNLAEFLD